MNAPLSRLGPNPYTPLALDGVVEIERAVIGAVLMDNRILTTTSVRLLPEHFFVARHRFLWRAMVALTDAGQSASPVSLRGALGDLNSDGDQCLELALMATEAAPPYLFGRYAVRVVWEFIRRLVVELQQDHDRLMRSLPANISAEMMGAYLLVRVADIATRACGLDLGGRHLGGVDREVILSLIDGLLRMFEDDGLGGRS